ncbi:MAG TPA: S8 family peptidase [Pseudonocardiaceae bacterium]
MIPQLRRATLAVGLAAALGGLVGAAVPASSAEAGTRAGTRAGTAEGTVLYANAPDAVPGRYVVVLKEAAVTATVDGLARQYGGTVDFTYTAALQGFAVRADARAARRLAADPRVAYVAQDQKVGLAVSVQPNPPSWGLDRIDERSLPLDLKYHYPNTAGRVKAYIIDTGIRFTHQEFGGRAVPGVDTIGDGQNGNDCHGHGTHVAGTVGGRSVGVAKQVRLVAVRVLNCAGSGTYAQVIAGVDWVTQDAQLSRTLGVANMSLGGGFYQPLNDAVTASIDANVHYSVAAGNSNADACTASPASTPRATTLGATDITDTRAAFSNHGTCVDVFGPGVNIYSATATSDSSYASFSGTSMASPHAAGTAALWRMRFPADDADTVAGAIAANATPGVVVNPGVGSPNLLLFMGMIPV